MEFCPPKSCLTSAGFFFSSYMAAGTGFLEGVACRTFLRALTSEALVSSSLIFDKKGDYRRNEFSILVAIVLNTFAAIFLEANGSRSPS
jgi:hypothetical protein